MSGWWEVPDRPLCTANRRGYRWWQKTWTGMLEFIQLLFMKSILALHLLSCVCLLLTGKLPKGVLCILSNVTTSKQRRFLQDIVKHGHSTCTRGYSGKCSGVNLRYNYCFMVCSVSLALVILQPFELASWKVSSAHWCIKVECLVEKAESDSSMISVALNCDVLMRLIHAALVKNKYIYELTGSVLLSVECTQIWGRHQRGCCRAWWGFWPWEISVASEIFFFVCFTAEFSSQVLSNTFAGAAYITWLYCMCGRSGNEDHTLIEQLGFYFSFFMWFGITRQAEMWQCAIFKLNDFRCELKECRPENAWTCGVLSLHAF